MNKEKLKTIGIWNLLAVIAVLTFCIIHNDISTKQLKPEIITIHDTTTVTVETIKEKEKVQRVVEYDTSFIVERDTVRDTIYVSLPIAYKQYRDTFNTDTSRTIVDIKYSGYKAQLDGLYVESHYKAKETVKIKHTGFGQFVGIGLQLGYGASINPINKTFQPSPYIGVGVTYGWGYHW